MSLADVNIKRFNKDGNLLNVIGNGKGKGPGEFLHQNDFYIQGNDIWVTDTRLMKIMRFDVGGKFKNSFLVKYHPMRIHGFADNLLVKTIASDFIIKRLNHEGKKLAEFGNVVKNQMQYPLSVGGYIETFNDITIFAPHIASLIYYYKTDTLFKMARRPDGQSFKPSQKRETGEGKMVMAPEAEVEARTLFKMDNKLFAGEIIKKNSSTKNKSNTSTVIDCYVIPTIKNLISSSFHR